jgi:hypothetical protein
MRYDTKPGGFTFYASGCYSKPDFGYNAVTKQEKTDMKTFQEFRTDRGRKAIASSLLTKDLSDYLEQYIEPKKQPFGRHEIAVETLAGLTCSELTALVDQNKQLTAENDQLREEARRLTGLIDNLRAENDELHEVLGLAACMLTLTLNAS